MNALIRNLFYASYRSEKSLTLRLKILMLLKVEIIMETIQEIKSIALEYGAANSGIIDVKDIVFDPGLRKACEDKHCGNTAKI